jgi:predicted kinase
MNLTSFANSVTPGTALILRGCQGAGKSTLAHLVVGRLTGKICSADKSRIESHGTYVYKPEENGLHHANCLKAFINAAQNDTLREKGVLVCDNTNVSVEEVAPYRAIATAYGWAPIIVTIDVGQDAMVAARRQLHGVPTSQVAKVAHRIRDIRLPQNWTQITIMN